MLNTLQSYSNKSINQNFVLKALKTAGSRKAIQRTAKNLIPKPRIQFFNRKGAKKRQKEMRIAKCETGCSPGLAAIYVKKKIRGSPKQRKWCVKATYPTIEATDSRTPLKKHHP